MIIIDFKNKFDFLDSVFKIKKKLVFNIFFELDNNFFLIFCLRIVLFEMNCRKYYKILSRTGCRYGCEIV